MYTCSECGKPSVTKDGRHLCMKCLRKSIRRDTPVPGMYSRSRGPDKRAESEGDPSPWRENAVRHMEGD